MMGSRLDPSWYVCFFFVFSYLLGLCRQWHLCKFLILGDLSTHLFYLVFLCPTSENMRVGVHQVIFQTACPYLKKYVYYTYSFIKTILHRAKSEINSIMKHSHTYYVINDEKSLWYVLYSSGNIQIESTWCQAPTHHSLSLSYIKLTKTLVSGLLKESTFPIIRSRVRHSNAFDRLVRSPRKWIPLSITFLAFSIMPIRHCWIVKNFLKPHSKIDSIFFV